MLCAIVLSLAGASCAAADDAFDRQVAPFLKNYCFECHNRTKSEGALDLTRYGSAASAASDFRQWEHVLTFVRKGEMPPETAKQPTADERAALLKTLEGLLAERARDLAGDPGVVLPRRLSNAEYDYTIRDLTGVDLRPAAAFPVDPASGEGFSNTGEALVMSPNLFNKYYAAAQFTADHVVFAPTGFRFASYPVTTFADKLKYFEQALLEFYAEHDVRYESYLAAAWSYRHRPESRQSATIETWAGEHRLSPKYLARLWSILDDPIPDDPFLGSVRRRFETLPPPAAGGSLAAPDREIAATAARIRHLSTTLCARETQAIVSNAGNGPVQHVERRKKTALERDVLAADAFTDRRRLHVELRKPAGGAVAKIVFQAEEVAPALGVSNILLGDMNFSERQVGAYRPDDKANRSLRDLLLRHAPDEWKRLRPGVHLQGLPIGPDTVVVSGGTLEITVPAAAFADKPVVRFFAEATFDREHSGGPAAWIGLSDRPPAADELTALLVDPNDPQVVAWRTAAEKFCATFPNRFVYVDDTRGLSAGFHLVEGVFRDDRPLCKLVLGDEENRELDRLWEELYFGSGMIEKMLRGFVFFERSERNFLKHPDFDPFKEEDPDLVRDEKLARFEQAYLDRSGVRPDDSGLAANPIHLFFADIRRGLNERASHLAASEPIYLRQLLEFAARAWRRPLTEPERARLTQFYKSAAADPELGVEQAVRGVLTSLLVSPHFCFRVDVPPAGDTVRPLADLALASRLSYLLWSSMPDAELLALAEAGKLSDEAALRRQVDRMRQDPRVAGMALEFFGPWLRYRDFLSAESVDRTVFPAFDDALKAAMFEEPTRLATHLLRNDLPVTDMLYGDATLVNRPLAAHYGVTYRDGSDEWQVVDGMLSRGRGGVLGMAVFLTAHSQPARTSPVKRGFWVVHEILGEHIPPPPPDVAVLPAKETGTDGKTVRQLLAMHTEERACARCHNRFDSIGLAMEGFDPIGKSRTKDLAGRTVDDHVRLPDGTEARGVPQYLRYLETSRNDEFVRTLCRKFLGYALGRSIEISDHELLERMQADLRRNEYRFGSLVETVVLSPQFRNQRCRDFSIERFRAERQEPNTR